MKRRLAEVIIEFESYVAAYDRQVPFLRTGQYEWHRATIDRRRSWSDVRQAIADDVLLERLHHTLQKWGIGRRASRLAPIPEFQERLRRQAEDIAALEDFRLDDPHLDVPAAAERIWTVISHLEIVSNNALIVPATKTLHHLLPDLVPPMDRAWTGRFFHWSAAAPQYAQQATFTRTLAGFATIACAVEPTRYVGEGWRTSTTKVLDNAIIGYCQTRGIL